MGRTLCTVDRSTALDDERVRIDTSNSAGVCLEGSHEFVKFQITTLSFVGPALATTEKVGISMPEPERGYSQKMAMKVCFVFMEKKGVGYLCCTRFCWTKRTYYGRSNVFIWPMFNLSHDRESEPLTDETLSSIDCGPVEQILY